MYAHIEIVATCLVVIFLIFGHNSKCHHAFWTIFGHKKARGFLKCFHCGKRRMIYTKDEKTWLQNKLSLQQKIESVGLMFSCGDLLFGDGPMSKILVQRQSLTCESRIEGGYYNPNTPTPERKLRTKPICVHCGCGGSSDFLLTMKEMKGR